MIDAPPFYDRLRNDRCTHLGQSRGELNYRMRSKKTLAETKEDLALRTAKLQISGKVATLFESFGSNTTMLLGRPAQ
jgi:hypothetical protein